MSKLRAKIEEIITASSDKYWTEYDNKESDPTPEQSDTIKKLNAEMMDDIMVAIKTN